MVNKKNITGIILAGGKSSRMGSDKAGILFKGKAFIEHVIEALKPLVDEIIIVSNKDEHDRFNYKRITDTLDDAGPIAGLHAGLAYSNTENNLVLSCDVPLIQTSVLEMIIAHNEEGKDVILLKEGSKSHPLIAFYKKNTAPHFFSLLKQGERRLSTAVNGLNVKSVSVSKAHQKALRNINTMSDLNSIEYGNKH